MFRLYFVLAIIGLSVTVEPSECDSDIKPVTKEGNVGETSIFPWLGVLRVHLHDEGSFKIALTGIVYVKEGYAIANADDVARIPKRIFKEDSKAMFIPADNSPWTCNLVDYMTHPEYEYSTMNTIALLELDLGMETHFPMKPICWPPYSFNTSNELYALGFTDENTLLEKSVYSVQYVDQKLCQEFYNRAGLTEKHLTPTHCQCGFAKNNKENCVWDNGMALASNSTEYWTLVGFGIRGPGCAAPARFMDILPFLPWIDSATNADEIEEDLLQFRKSAFGEGFKKATNNKSKEIILDEVPDLRKSFNGKYPFETASLQDQLFKIHSHNKSSVYFKENTTTTQPNLRAKNGRDGPEMPDYAGQVWIQISNRSLKPNLKKLRIGNKMNTGKEFKGDYMESELVSSGARTLGLIEIIAMEGFVLVLFTNVNKYNYA